MTESTLPIEVGDRLIRGLVDAGWIPPKATRVLIDASIGGLVTVYSTHIGDIQCVDVILATAARSRGEAELAKEAEAVDFPKRFQGWKDDKKEEGCAH